MSAPSTVTRPAFAPRRVAAMDIVELHTALAVGANFIPFPVVDSLAVSAVQLKMIAALARFYGADFEIESGRAVVASLTIGFAQEAVRRTSAAEMFRCWVVQIPVLGLPLRKLGWPAILACYTYVLGRSYVEHFESGGRFHDFKPQGLLNSPVTRVVLSPTGGHL
jgi:uncharacterized protein (DUF697 family)